MKIPFTQMMTNAGKKLMGPFIFLTAKESCWEAKSGTSWFAWVLVMDGCVSILSQVTQLFKKK